MAGRTWPKTATRTSKSSHVSTYVWRISGDSASSATSSMGSLVGVDTNNRTPDQTIDRRRNGRRTFGGFGDESLEREVSKGVNRHVLSPQHASDDWRLRHTTKIRWGRGWEIPPPPSLFDSLLCLSSLFFFHAEQKIVAMAAHLSHPPSFINSSSNDNNNSKKQQQNNSGSAKDEAKQKTFHLAIYINSERC